MSIYKIQRDKEFVILECKILQNKNLSLQGRAYYAMLEAEVIKISEIPLTFIKELITIGYLEDLEEEVYE